MSKSSTIDWLRKISLLAVVCFWICLASCIPMDDPGEYWDKAVLDPRLEGHWKRMGVKHRSEDLYCSVLKSGTHYILKMKKVDMPDLIEQSRVKPYQVKSLHVGKHSFLLSRAEMPAMLSKSLGKEDRKGQARPVVQWGITRYVFEGDTLIQYELGGEVWAKAIQTGEINGRLEGSWGKDGPGGKVGVISKLDGGTLTALAKLADEPANWRVVSRYQRVEDLQKSLSLSRTYPAGQDTRANTLVDITLPDLKYFADGKTDVLLRHLRASPEWKVFKTSTYYSLWCSQDEILCHERERKGDRWQEGINSPYRVSEPMDFENRWQISKLFRFGKQSGGAFRKSDYSMEIGPLAGKTHLTLKSSSQGIESYLAVGEKGIWYEFFEQRQSEPRTYTREGLKWLKSYLQEVRRAEKEIQDIGYAVKLMPVGGVKKGKPSMEITQTIGAGFYDVVAWLNPGRKGEVSLRLFEAKTGKELRNAQPMVKPGGRMVIPPERVTISRKSAELIGWSKDPNVLFYYDGSPIFYAGAWDDSYDVRFELWFKDDTTGKNEMLIKRIQRIKCWERQKERSTR